MNLPDWAQFFLYLCLTGGLLRLYTYNYPETRLAAWLAFIY